MAKYIIQFIRTVREFHTAVVTAENEQEAEQFYDNGELNTFVNESKIIDEDGPYISEEVS